MVHHVVISEWNIDDETGTILVGVYHNINKAKEMLREYVDTKDRTDAENNNYEIFEDTDVIFDAGINGYYANNHLTTKIVTTEDSD